MIGHIFHAGAKIQGYFVSHIILLIQQSFCIYLK